MTLSINQKVDELRREPEFAPLTVGEFLAHLLPRLKDDPHIPEWPADVFGLCMSLIQKTGAYCDILCNWPPSSTAPTPRIWEKEICSIGRRWRESCIVGAQPPKFAMERWERLLASRHLPISQLRRNMHLAQSLLELCATADEACPGIGVPDVRTLAQTPVDEKFFEFADRLLLPTDYGSTLCIEIHPSRARVLPKMHTPQSGLTIRSLSHHLALCSTDEIIPRWIAAVPTIDKADKSDASNPRTSINLLIVPWPKEVYPVQFGPSQPLSDELRNMDRDRFGFFTVSHPQTSAAVDHISNVLKVAEATMGSIDGVILPELALSEDEYPAVVSKVHQTGAFFICGRAKAAMSGEAYGANQAVFDMPSLQQQCQHKHHRWKLEKFQIARYGLGSRLHPEIDWWEL